MSRELARKRERLANAIGQEEIWQVVVRNALSMNATIEMRADILLDAIKDLAIIFKYLKINHDEGRIDHDEYALLLERCIKKIETSKDDREFNPLNLTDI